VGKQGNVARTSTQDVRKVGAEPKSNNDNGAVRPRWVDYDIVDGGFKDETIGEGRFLEAWKPKGFHVF
jgi:hypothetical protein